VVVDHPYHKVKAEAWDREQEDAAGFLDWTRGMVKRYRRILRPNGSLYVFASPDMGSRVECVVREEMHVLTNIRWKKRSAEGEHSGQHGRAEKEALRSYFPASETIIFAEHYGADNIAKGEAGYGAKCDELRGFVFEPLRAYLDGERGRAGFSRSDCDAATGNQMSGHYFSRVQWTLPTKANYEKLREAFNARAAGEHLRREYEDLRREYEDLRREYEDLRREYEDLRRPFTVSAEVPYTDVWEFQTVQAYPGKHPCEKPPDMAEHIINASSRPGALVADFFCGSGVFLAEAVRLGRRAIGCDMSERWARRARQLIERPRVKLREAPPADERQLNWLESA
jgi:site-specific DNA-methyltransferase (adenine-specific)